MAKLIYLAGGIRTVGGALRDTYYPDGRVGWREVAGLLLAPDFTVIDPKTKQGSDPPYGVNEIVDLDLFDIRRSTAVLMEMMDPTYPYIGTTQELVYAKLYGKPVVLFGAGHRLSHPWVKYHVTKGFGDFSDAIEFIKERFA